MKTIRDFSLALCFTLIAIQGAAQNGGYGTPAPTPVYSDPIYFGNSPGDKISLYANRIGMTNAYGFGVGDMTLYHKTNGNYAWVRNTNVLSTDNATDIFYKSQMYLQGGGSSGTMLSLREPSLTNASRSGEIRLLEAGETTRGGFMRYDGAQDKMHLGVWANNYQYPVITIPVDSRVVGIGTLTPDPDYKLSVNGKIRAKEVRVESNWADYVFEPGYELPSLDSVAKFIEANGHLPGIPAAAEIQQNGLELGELQTLMMQKIEELTLYVIELKKENEALKAERETK